MHRRSDLSGFPYAPLERRSYGNTSSLLGSLRKEQKLSRAVLTKQRRKPTYSIFILLGSLCIALLLISTIRRHHSLSSDANAPQERFPNIRRKRDFVPTLRNKKILFEITTVGLRQYSYFESVLDGVRDLCESGAKVSLHIITANCPPSSDIGVHVDSNYVCPLYDRAFETTVENNYSVDRLSQLNERLHCRNVEGSLDATVHLISPDWGKQVVDHHRRIFYEHLDEFDLFVHGEEDAKIRPTNIIAFMEEMHKVEMLVGTGRLSDYSIGFVRYENQVDEPEKRRVVWEFDWGEEVDFNDLIVRDTHPNIDGKYFSSPGQHHQGMYMALPEQLRRWRTRAPNCQFDKPSRRVGYHRERISGGIDLYDEEYCNVTQLIPLDSMEDLFIHHLPDANHNRMPENIISTMNLHKRRMKVLQGIKRNDFGQIPWTESKTSAYSGIKMILDERDSKLFLPYNLKEYHDYVERGGTLDRKQLDEYR